MRSLKDQLHLVPLFAPKAAVTDDTQQVSATIDRRDYESLLLCLITGTLTDADAVWLPAVYEGDASNMSDEALVADADLDPSSGGELAFGFQFDDDIECTKLAYCGNKRYVRVKIDTTTANTGNLFLAGVAILGHPKVRPTPTLA